MICFVWVDVCVGYGPVVCVVCCFAVVVVFFVFLLFFVSDE